MDAILKFWEQDLGRFGMFGLVLVVLEKMLEYNFVCPCKQNCFIVSCNIASFCLIVLVPAFGCFISTCCFVDVMPELNNNKKNKCCNSACRSSCCKCCRRFCYSLLTVVTWFSIILIDGRYLACYKTNWEGVYTNSITFGKWCKPTGNETSEIKSQEMTMDFMFLSQCLGLVLTVLNIILLALLNCSTCTVSTTSARTSARNENNFQLLYMSSNSGNRSQTV